MFTIFLIRNWERRFPHGVYDLNHNEAGVSVGITHDTAEFAVEAIRRWWNRLGRKPAMRTRGDCSSRQIAVAATVPAPDSGNSNPKVRRRDGDDH